MSIVYLAGVGEKIREWFQGFWGAFLSMIPKIGYFLCTLIFQILDILQLLVRKVAGLDVVYYSTDTLAEGTASSGDIVLHFINAILTGSNSVLSNIFWAFIILGVVLLVITTFVAVLRSEYAATDAKSASKAKIIGKALKAIASFAIVPIVAFFGIYLSNVILQALDTISSGTSASSVYSTYQTGEKNEDGSLKNYSVSNFFQEFTTSTGQKTYITYNFWGGNAGESEKSTSVPTTSTPISGLIFKAAAYKANRVRNSSYFQSNLSNANVGAGIFDKFGTQYSKSATLVDDCFANAYTLKTEVTLTSEPFKDDYLYKFGSKDSIIGNYAPSTFSTFDKNNVQQVWYYYDLWSFDFVICIAALVISAKLLIYLVFGLMKRIFEVLILFLIAPPIASIMPLDEGAALKKWREKFTSKVIAAYGPIVGMNLFFVILPFVTEIKFFNIPFIDAIINMFFVIVGLIMVKDLCGTISELIGGENSLKAGEDMSGEVGKSLAKVGQIAAAPAGFALKGAKFGIGVAKNGVGAVVNRFKNNKEDKQHLMNQAENNGTNLIREFTKLNNDENSLDSQIRTAQTDLNTAAPGSRAHKSAQARLNRLTQERDDIRNRRNELQTSSGWTLDRLTQYRNSTNADDQATILRNVRRGMSAEQHQAAHAFAESDEGRTRARARRMAYRRATWGTPAGQAGIGQHWNNSLNSFVDDRHRGHRGGWAAMSDHEREEAIQDHMDDARNLNRNRGIVRFGHRREDANFASQELNLRGRYLTNRLATLTGTTLAGSADQEAYLNNTQTERQKHLTLKAIPGAGLLKQENFEKAGKTLAKAFKDTLVDNLNPLFSALGENLAKGFKDAGGFGKIELRLQGKSGKEEKLAEEIKNQKRILSAQDKASQLLGRGGGGPSTVKLDDASIKKLADEITKKS